MGEIDKEMYWELGISIEQVSAEQLQQCYFGLFYEVF